MDEQGQRDILAAEPMAEESEDSYLLLFRALQERGLATPRPVISNAHAAFPQLDARKISSAYMLERLNREIRRRTNVAGIFPNPDAYTRLVTTYLMEYAEDWSASRAYLSEQSMRSLLHKAA